MINTTIDRWGDERSSGVALAGIKFLDAAGGGSNKNQSCPSVGYRTSKIYCSESGWISQKDEASACKNNFECKTNVCSDGKCISGGLIRKVIGWLANLFGK